MKQQVNLDIMTFIEQQILPRYNAFGKSHGLGHVQRVIKNSLQLASLIGADLNMAYVTAAYHDLGMEGPRAIHHITSGKILLSDARLRKWFSPEQDHRASASHEPRSIYGKIVAEADRDLDPEVVFTRAILYGIEHNPELDKEGQWKRFDRHMEEKYSSSGYMRLWIPKSPNEESLRQIRETIVNKMQLREVFNQIYERESAK